MQSLFDGEYPMNNEIKHCCEKCFNEKDIIDYIKSDDMKGDCRYCGNEDVYTKNVIDVGQFVLAGFLRYYEDAAEHVYHDSSEGGYQLPTKTIHGILLWEDPIFGDDLKNPELLVKDLVDDNGTPYVRKDPYGPLDGGVEDISSWKGFCDIVKTKRRFTSLLRYEDESYSDDHPENFLNNLSISMSEMLLEDLHPGNKIYRARIQKDANDFCHKDLTSPPIEKTVNCRMSPVGISFFYGGLDERVCIAEVNPGISDTVVVAEFEVITALKLLDLSVDLGDNIGPFSEAFDFSFERYFKPFIKYFLNDISRPIRSFEKKINYTPTQAFTEYIRFKKFREINPLIDGNDINTYKINGIKYKSGLLNGGINIVLFRGDDVSTEKNNDKNAWLLFNGFKEFEVTNITWQYKEIIPKKDK